MASQVSAKVAESGEGVSASKWSRISSISSKQVLLIVGALVVIGGAAVGVATSGAPASATTSTPGPNPSLTFCEQVYSYPTFVNQRESGAWSFFR